MRHRAIKYLLILLLLASPLNAYATIIHYSISGNAYYWPTSGWYEEGGPDEPPSTEIVGDAYISDIGTGGYIMRWDIVSFALVIGEYGFGGYGELYSHECETGISLHGSGTWGEGVWGTGQTYPNTLTELPDFYDFGSCDNSGWFNDEPSIDGPLYTAISNDGEYYCRVNRFILTKAAPVPEPATFLLIGSGLLGLAGFRKKFKSNKID